MSAIKNFFSKKSEKIDGGVAVAIVAGSMLISGLSMAQASPEEQPAPAPVVTSVSGSAGGNLTYSGETGASLNDVASVAR